jgi:membrane protease YdiL (CAAX protease family)
MVKSQYYFDSRSPRYAILFAAPLLLAYETLAWLLNSPESAGVRNGADVLLKAPFVLLAGYRGVIVFDALLLTLGAWLVVRDWRRHPGPLQLRVFALMFAEAIGLALIVGVVLRYATAALLHYFVLANPANLGTPVQLMVSLGAGVYEELLFRVILVGGLSLLGSRMFGWSPRGAAVFAVLLSALLFSSFHYVGAYGDTLRFSSFLFRLLAGLVFSTLYVLRGFGITGWTHALYDIIVTVTG